jgi:hypothetical protein
MFAELEGIYDDRTLSADDKWKQWWNLLFPAAGEAPDPRHHDTISISTASMDTLKRNFLEMWRANGNLPHLNVTAKEEAATTLVETLLRTTSVIQQRRRQSMHPRTTRTRHTASTQPCTPHTLAAEATLQFLASQTPLTTENLQDIPYMGGSSSAYAGTSDQILDDWDSRMSTVGNGDDEGTFNSVDTGYAIGRVASYNASSSTAFSNEYGEVVNLPYEQNP